jgi:hypothetical protein
LTKGYFSIIVSLSTSSHDRTEAMKLFLILWRLICGVAVVGILAAIALLVVVSRSQHASPDLGLAHADTLNACPSNSTHEYAIIQPDGSVNSVGNGNVSFDLKSTSGLRSAGVTLTPKSGMVVKAAEIYGDANGTSVIASAKGTNVSQVRAGQLNRSAVVARADACVGKAGILGHIAAIAKVIGNIVAAAVFVIFALVFSAGFIIGHHSPRRHPAERMPATTSS